MENEIKNSQEDNHREAADLAEAQTVYNNLEYAMQQEEFNEDDEQAYCEEEEETAPQNNQTSSKILSQGKPQTFDVAAPRTLPKMDLPNLPQAGGDAVQQPIIGQANGNKIKEADSIDFESTPNIS